MSDEIQIKHPSSKISAIMQATNYKNRGISALVLYEFGFTFYELIHCGFSIGDLGETDFNETDRNLIRLNDKGCSAGSLKEQGYNAKQLINAGYTVDSLLKAGYLRTDIWPDEHSPTETLDGNSEEMPVESVKSIEKTETSFPKTVDKEKAVDPVVKIQIKYAAKYALNHNIKSATQLVDAIGEQFGCVMGAIFEQNDYCEEYHHLSPEVSKQVEYARILKDNHCCFLISELMDYLGEDYECVRPQIKQLLFPDYKVPLGAFQYRNVYEPYDVKEFDKIRVKNIGSALIAAPCIEQEEFRKRECEVLEAFNTTHEVLSKIYEKTGNVPMRGEVWAIDFDFGRHPGIISYIDGESVFCYASTSSSGYFAYGEREENMMGGSQLRYISKSLEGVKVESLAFKCNSFRYEKVFKKLNDPWV